jgi:acetylglutamate synthase
MGVSDLTAAQVMSKSASLMNDTAMQVYTYTASLPYLQIALQELQEYFQLHSISTIENTSAVITVPSGTTEVGYNAIAPIPSLPSDMVEPAEVWARQTGTGSYSPLTRRDFIAPSLASVPVSSFSIYVWQDQKIKLPPSNQSNDLKIQYNRELFTNIVDSNSFINVINARTFLEFRTAALLAQFIERNESSASALNNYAGLALDRATGIQTRGKQRIMTRRRPFRSGYKRSG